MSVHLLSLPSPIHGVLSELKNRRVRSKNPHARRRLHILIGVSALIGVFLFALLLDSAIYYNKIHRGVSISGHSVSRLTRDEAFSTMSRLVQEAQKKPVTLTSGAKSWDVLPDDVGTRIQVTAAVAEAMDVTRDGNFFSNTFRRLKLHFCGVDIPLNGTVDDAKMEELLISVSEELDIPPVNAGLVFTDLEVKVVEGQKGLVVDRATLREQLAATLFTLHNTELPIPMVTAEPAIKAKDSREAVIQAKRMVAQPVTLTYGESSWKVTPEQIIAYMDFSTEKRNNSEVLVSFLSPAKMEPFFDKVAGGVDKKPVNASFKGDGEKAWVVPAVPGRALDREETARALTAAALKTDGRVAEAATKTTEPGLTTKEAEAMGITAKLGSFSTKWEGTKDRQTNVRKATEYANNVLLAPGEVFDFDKQVGPRTEKRGFKPAPGIVRGELEDQLGGGICQVATTLFNAAFFAGLEIVERKNHSLYIDHYPKGRDATVSAGGPNLRFRNDTKHHILVRGSSDGINTTFVIYGTREGRKVEYETSDFYDVKEMTVVSYAKSDLGTGTTEIKTNGQTGKAIKVTRTVKDRDGQVIRKDTFISTWKMIPREVYVGTKGASTTTTTEAAATTTTKPAPTPTTGAQP